MDLLALAVGITLSPLYPIVALYIGVLFPEDVAEAYIIIREVLLKLFDGVLHSPIIYLGHTCCQGIVALYYYLTKPS